MKTSLMLKLTGLLLVIAIVYLKAGNMFALACDKVPAHGHSMLEFSFGIPSFLFLVVGAAAGVALPIVLLTYVTEQRE